MNADQYRNLGRVLELLAEMRELGFEPGAHYDRARIAPVGGDVTYLLTWVDDHYEATEDRQ